MDLPMEIELVKEGEQFRIKDPDLRNQFEKKYIVRGTYGPLFTEKETKEEDNKDKNFIKLNQMYDIRYNVKWRGNFIDKKEYTKLKNNPDSYEHLRLVELSPKQWKAEGFTRHYIDYEPTYEERELNEKQIQARIKSNKARKYATEAPIIDHPDKFGKLRLRGMAVMAGEGVQLGPLVYYANIKEAFSDAKAVIEIIITRLGEFRVNPVRRRKNDEMTNIIEELTENLQTLQQKMG